jgi:RND superfamily putative drug exporter
LVEFDVTLSAPPSSAASFATIDSLRTSLGAIQGANALVGGDVAAQLDYGRANRSDALLIAPIILVIVLLVLLVLLRSLVAPFVLLATVIATYLSSLGISWVIFVHVMHYPAIAAGVRLNAFLFLVALGVDYNIFLTARAREETPMLGTRGGMLSALRSTGGVITSAGILLAAVFAVLGVLPLIQLTQVGTIVCVGVLLDTLLVRTVLVPALTLLLGDRFWWPKVPAPAALAKESATVS